MGSMRRAHGSMTRVCLGFGLGPGMGSLIPWIGVPNVVDWGPQSGALGCPIWCIGVPNVVDWVPHLVHWRPQSGALGSQSGALGCPIWRAGGAQSGASGP